MSSPPTAPDTNSGNNSGPKKKTTLDRTVLLIVVALTVSSFFAGYFVRDSDQSILSISASPAKSSFTMEQIPSTQPPTSDKRILISSDDPARGMDGASITIIEFSDFQCPYCQRFSTQTLPQIVEQYVDTGMIKHIYRDFPIKSIHPNAMSAAVAAQCANEQGKFWQYHDILFEKQNEWARLSAASAIEKFKQYAADLMLDKDGYSSCVDSGKYTEEIAADIQDGTRYGVSGTPTFFIGNDKDGYVKVVGSQAYSTFQRVIEERLSPTLSGKEDST